MRLVPNNPNQLSGPNAGDDVPRSDLAADSTWRSMALQKQIAANITDEDKDAEAGLTLDDLAGMALTRSGFQAQEYGADNGSYSADKLIIPPTGGPGSAYGGQYSSLETS